MAGAKWPPFKEITMSSYNEKLQEFFQLYRAAGNDGAASAKEVAGWAFEQGLWKPRTSDVIKILAEDLSRAWREDYRTDKKGRRYRVKHPVRKTENGGTNILVGRHGNCAPRAYADGVFSTSPTNCGRLRAIKG
jgi:hypothetical protein